MRIFVNMNTRPTPLAASAAVLRAHTVLLTSDADSYPVDVVIVATGAA